MGIKRHRIGRRIVAWSGIATAVALILFHAVLFARRVRDLTILEPMVALQWVGALVLLAVLGLLLWKRVSLMRGRAALAFWLLVLLLHVLPAAPTAIVETQGSELLLALPTIWTATLGLALLLGALLGGFTVQAVSAGRRWPQAGPSALWSSGFCSRLYARPPPVPSR